MITYRATLDVPVETLRIDHLDRDPAVTSSDDAAARTSGHRVKGFDLEDQARARPRDGHQVEAVEVQEKVASIAAIERVRAYATMLEHRRGAWCEQSLESAHHRGPRRLFPAIQHHRRAHTQL